MKKIWLLLSLCVLFAVGCNTEKATNNEEKPSETTEAAENNETETASNDLERLKNKEEIRIAIPMSKFDDGFDPCNGWASHGESPIFQSTLLKINNKNELINDLATSYNWSEDGLVLEFTIRDDVVFHNGDKLTASDVAFTYNKAKEIGTAFELSFFDKAEAIDDTTVRLKLLTPNSTFLYDTATLGIVPEKLYDEGYAFNPIGSGPYKLVSYEPGSQVVIERFDDYYEPFEAFKKVVLVLMSNDQAYAAIKSGEVDVSNISENLGKDAIEGYRLEALESYDFRTISMPMAEERTLDDGRIIGNKVTSDEAVRKALAIGINREEIINDVLYGFGEIAFDPYDKFPWGIKEEFKDFKDNDIEKASEILEKAGWKLNGEYREKDGQACEFTLMYASNDVGRQAIANGFMAQAKKLGIKVNLEGLDWSEIAPRIRHDACVFAGGIYNPNHIEGSMHSRYGESDSWDNVVVMNNPTVDKHIEAAIASTSEEEAIQNWKKASWDGQTGGSMLGDSGYITVGFVQHLYFVRDGIDIGKQFVHPHDHGIAIISNLTEWDYK